EEGPRRPQHHGCGEDELRPGERCGGNMRQQRIPPHGDRYGDRRERQRPPEAATKVDELRVLAFLERRHLRLERHAADRTMSGPALPGLRVHGACVHRRLVVGPLIAREVFDNRTFGPMVAAAVLGELNERPEHRLQLRDLALELGDVLRREPLHLGAFPAAIVPKRQQLADLLDIEPDVARALHEAQAMHVRRRIDAIAGGGSAGRGDEPDLLVVADHLRRNTRRAGRLADVDVARAAGVGVLRLNPCVHASSDRKGLPSCTFPSWESQGPGRARLLQTFKQALECHPTGRLPMPTQSARRPRPSAARETKDLLYALVARLTKALASPKRLELLEILCQGPKPVEALARESDITVSLASAHLKELRDSRLVNGERSGKNVVYRLASPEIARSWVALRALAEERLVELREAMRELGAPDSPWHGEGREVLLRKARRGDVLVLDVRPAAEYDEEHLPFARSLPVAELPRDRPIVAYCRGPFCLMSDEAVKLLSKRGYRACKLADGVAEWRAAGMPLESRPPGARSGAAARTAS